MRETDVRSQLAATGGDALRVLVVGAGVAGLSVAQLLRRDGLHPVLVERGAPGAAAGYVLALLPLADPVLDALGVREAYRARSTALHRYRARSRTGRVLREERLDRLVDPYGDYRGIARGELLRTLAEPGGTLSHGTTVTALAHTGSAVRATLTTRGPGAAGGGGERVEGEFDLVVAADGLRSALRPLLLGERGTRVVDTGWDGWVAWAGTDAAEDDLVEETWGAGFFAGSYPVLGGTGVFVGGPRRRTAAGSSRFVAAVRERLTDTGGALGRALDAVAAAEDPYRWPLTDCRSSRWATGRVVLLGDAAAGFLPTAGVGAGMAMESAHVLAAHLRGAGAPQVPAVLAAYERQQRPRVHAAQRTSRQLATLVFRRHRALAAVRDLATAHVGLGTALAPVTRLLAEPPRVPRRAEHGT
ncbi:FAD-dependent oxidoreductase [Kineococcus arenarius]|uniref:FAD-dependent oxidoreductase n=1 Tax=unclassified Kineococcus TaxID=2621656 RepID=UPI003D7CE951